MCEGETHVKLASLSESFDRARSGRVDGRELPRESFESCARNFDKEVRLGLEMVVRRA
jgi:hypothetical protein